jgi:hypothetical protein
MDACDGGTPRAAVEADVLASVRSLLDRKIVEPAR